MKRLNILFCVPLFFLLLSAGEPARNPFPEVERYKLKNGMEIIFADYGELPVSSFTFFINVGSKSETPGQQGLADLTANSLLMGNEKYSRVDLDEQLYAMGTGIDAGANENYTVVTGDFLNKDVEKGMDMLAAVMLQPTFPQTEIDEQRGFVLAQNKPDKMDIGALADMYGNYFTYGIGHPLGRHLYETQYKKITTAQIKEFYKFNYTPGNTKLVVTGKPDRALVKKLAEQYFGNWNAAYGEMNSSSYDIPAMKTKEYAFVNKDGATQACLEWFKKAPDAGSKDLLAFKLANAVFSDRLMKDIREKRGYTYGIYSRYSEENNDGIFRTKTQVRNDVMYQTLTAFDEVVSGFYTNKIMETDLRKMKTQFRNAILGIEDPGSFADEINPWLYTDYNKRKQYLAEIDALDVATVNKAVKKYFKPDEYKVMIAGDSKTLDPQLQKISNLQKLDLSVIEKDQ